MEVLEFVKRGFNGEAVDVKEVRGWKTDREEKAWMVVKAGHVEKGDSMVHSGLVIVTFCLVALKGLLDLFRGVG